jgi:hypothetical protein
MTDLPIHRVMRTAPSDEPCNDCGERFDADLLMHLDQRAETVSFEFLCDECSGYCPKCHPESQDAS